jgi:putative DNA methylase
MNKVYKKKLIEVAIPLEAINAASVREKSIRHGHPSTLHLWWARRPLAACRAVLFAQLVDDPSSLPEQFPTTEAQDAERKRLFGIIEELVQWENSTNEEVLERARAEIRKSCGGELPPVYDPFSGGGSIPLEAQRLGLPAYGSDLNPVAVMIGKAMIEIPPKFKNLPPIHPGIKERSFYRNAEGLAEDVKYYGEWMREKALERIGHLYPQVDLPKEYGGGKATAVAWLWARTVPSPDPAFASTQVPLVRSFDVSTKPKRRIWVEPVVDGADYRFEIRSEEAGHKKSGPEGTVIRNGGRCIVSGAAMPFSYIRDQGAAGRMSQKLMAVVAEGARGRVYLAPTSEQEAIALDVVAPNVPNIKLSGKTRVNVSNYGLDTFADLFTSRQLRALDTFCELLEDVKAVIRRDAVASGLSESGVPVADGGAGAEAYSDAIAIYLAFAISKVADRGSTICTWFTDRDSTRNTFARQAIPMTWDFAEMNVLLDGTGSFRGAVEWTANSVEGLTPNTAGSERQLDAREAGSAMSQKVVSTDPPYYDNIDYSDLSDFFYMWLKRSLQNIYPELFSSIATPKGDELVASQFRHKSRSEAERYFMEGMREAIQAISRNADLSCPTTIYYAFKQSEIAEDGISSTGWASFLQAVLDAGFAVVGTWPMRTELSNRMIASGSNALANSVVLVCRKKEATAEVITRAEFIRALKRELPPAIAELQAANIAPADMPQSAIGPGMGVFSRYKTVLESDDSPMSVKTALQLINRELDEYLGGIQGEFDADSRFAITWFEQYGMAKGDYGVADSIARARGISVESVKHAGIVESAAGKVRILSRDELGDDWEPGNDGHLTVWECLQHLVRQHEKDGIAYDTAVLLKKIEAKAEAVKDLAYCLYDICANKRKDAKEATAYNALIADWTELTRQAAAIHDTSGNRQARLDV